MSFETTSGGGPDSFNERFCLLDKMTGGGDDSENLVIEYDLFNDHALSISSQALALALGVFFKSGII